MLNSFHAYCTQFFIVIHFVGYGDFHAVAEVKSEIIGAVSPENVTNENFTAFLSLNDSTNYESIDLVAPGENTII